MNVLQGFQLTQLRHEQFIGVVIGLAVGDALGSAWEGVTSDLIYEIGPADKIVAHDSGETIFYTDDTQMMIGVVQALLECGEIEKRTCLPHWASALAL